MKKYIMLCALLGMALTNATAHARNFYKTSFLVDIDYSHIDEGNKLLVEGFPVTVEYSDDFEFCRFTVEGQHFDCQAHAKTSITDPIINIDREEGQAFLYRILETQLKEDQFGIFCYSCQRNRPPHRTEPVPPPAPKPQPKYLKSFERLLTHLLDPIDLEVSSEFYQQLHDSQPESFEVVLRGLTESEKY